MAPDYNWYARIDLRTGATDLKPAIACVVALLAKIHIIANQNNLTLPKNFQQTVDALQCRLGGMGNVSEQQRYRLPALIVFSFGM